MKGEGLGERVKRSYFAILPGSAILLMLVLGYGCHTTPNAAGGPVTAPPVASPPAQTAPAEAPTQKHASKTPIKDRLEEILAAEARSESSPFPKGTKLKSVNLEDGVLTIDFSREFNQLANMGESAESETQKTLRRAMEGFSNVLKMRVTVEGKPFESQATDWNTPFPVHGADLEASESREARRSTNSEGRP